MLNFVKHPHATTRNRLLAGAICLLALSATQARAQLLTAPPTSWELAGEFDDGHNPSGVWSYGYEVVLGQNFKLLTQPVLASQYNPSLDLKGWSLGSSDPSIVHNVNMVPWDNHLTGYPYPVTFNPRAIGMAPSTTCEYAVVRFTVPTTGRYRINGQFYGEDLHSVNGLEENVMTYVLVNNSTVFTGNVHPVANIPKASFSALNPAAVLPAGSTIDFAVGCGPNNDFWFGSTGLHAVIQKKPL